MKGSEDSGIVSLVSITGHVVPFLTLYVSLGSVTEVVQARIRSDGDMSADTVEHILVTYRNPRQLGIPRGLLKLHEVARIDSC